MTIRELIEELQKFSPDAQPVFAGGDFGTVDIETVAEGKPRILTDGSEYGTVFLSY